MPPLRSLFRRKPVETKVAQRVVVELSAQMLLCLSPDAPVTSPNQKIVGGTLNISETGLAGVTSSLLIGGTAISEGSKLRLELDLHPSGIIRMMAEVVRIEKMEAEEARQFNNLLGLRIVEMSHADRARYVEYIGSRGWEQVVKGVS